MAQSPVAPSVRPARTSDVDAIASVQVRAWRDSYAESLPRALLDGLDTQDIAWDWGRALLAGGDHRILVAVSGGTGDVVGVASIGPTADPDLDSTRVGEIGALEIDPAHRRVGHASRLMAAAVDLLREQGMAECVVWVPLADEPRRALLQSAGWGPDGAFRDLDAGDGSTLRQVRLGTVIADDDVSDPDPALPD